MHHLARQTLALAERQTATFPRMLGNSRVGMSLFVTGDIVAGRAYLDQAIALYDPAEFGALATRFGQDVGMTILAIRALNKDTVVAQSQGVSPVGTFFLRSHSTQEPPWEGCRAASKTEYESAKRDFLLQTSVGAYATTGHWWRRYYWYCHL